MITVQEEINTETITHEADVLDSMPIFRIAGNRFLRTAPFPRGKMADIPLQKSNTGLTSADVLEYLREDCGHY